MSQQTLARTQQVLGLVSQQLPAIFQAANTPNLDMRAFLVGTINRAGIAIDHSIYEFVQGLCSMMADPPAPQASDATELPPARVLTHDSKVVVSATGRDAAA